MVYFPVFLQQSLSQDKKAKGTEKETLIFCKRKPHKKSLGSNLKDFKF